MDTSGHTELSIVGEELLKPALERANHKKMRIEAFYLGNWLTDVSQCIDARAYKGFKHKAQDLLDTVDRIFSKFLDDVPVWWPNYQKFVSPAQVETLRRQVRAAGNKLRKQIELVLADGASGKLAHAFKAIFRYLGYSKFVASEDGSDRVRMDPTMYYKVFNNRYTEYFPHEHLDRPEITADHYDQRTQNIPKSKYTKIAQDALTVYTYLREDTKIAAGILAYLDAGTASPPRLSWAVASFHPHHQHFIDQNGELQAVDDKNYEWNRHLALFGHALHAVEDFFAHSNFVEHAAAGEGKTAGLPEKYRRSEVVEEQETFVRRLKQWSPGVDAMALGKVPREPHVVTGYFDLTDTVLSLAHVIEKLGKLERRKLGTTIDDAREYKYGKLLADTLDLYHDQKAVWHDPKNDPAKHGYDPDKGNLAVAILRKRGGTGLKLAEGKERRLNQVARSVAENALHDYPKEVRDDFVEAVKGLGSAVGTAMVGVSLYKTLKEVLAFFTDPLKWLHRFLPEDVYQFLSKHGEVYLRRWIAHLWGSDRIGCHSLLAKDSGPELFHKAAMDCAKAVHWYVVHAMVRHGVKKTVAVARGDLAVKPINHLFQSEWIDWLELLEYYLAHPYATARKTDKVAKLQLVGSIIHVTLPDEHSEMSPDSLLNLAGRYGGESFVKLEGGPKNLTWEMIADANYPTAGLSRPQRRRQINAILRDTRTGVPVGDDINFAFRPGLPIIIPYQAIYVSMPWVPDGNRPWWYPVIVEGWRKITEVYDEGKPSPKPGKVGHQWVPVPHSEVLQLIHEADGLRKKLENAYHHEPAQAHG